jgi:hypothetical protein
MITSLRSTIQKEKANPTTKRIEIEIHEKMFMLLYNENIKDHRIMPTMMKPAIDTIYLNSRLPLFVLSIRPP